MPLSGSVPLSLSLVVGWSGEDASAGRSNTCLLCFLRRKRGIEVVQVSTDYIFTFLLYADLSTLNLSS